MSKYIYTTHCPACGGDYDRRRIWEARLYAHGYFWLAPTPCPWCGSWRDISWDDADRLRTRLLVYLRGPRYRHRRGMRFRRYVPRPWRKRR